MVERDGEERTLAVRLATSPAELPRQAADIVWLTTKATDTVGASPWLEVLRGPKTMVASAQNGLDHQARLAPWVPAEQVIPTLAYIAAERTGPGRVHHIAGNRLVVPSRSVPLVSDAVAVGGLVVRGTDDMLSASWKKLLGNLVANPITALTRRRISVMREEAIAELGRALLTEAMTVGRAEGAELSERDVEAVLQATTTYGEAAGSSMYYDVMAGRPLEHQYLTGEVVRRGRAHGIATPLNTAVLALLDALDRGGRLGV